MTADKVNCRKFSD